MPTDQPLQTAHDSASIHQTQAAIKLVQVSKTFAAVRALDRLTLNVRKQEVYGLLGPNGAGKSTTINILCGLLRPDEGSVEIAGLNAAAQPLQTKRLLGMVPQELALYNELSCEDNLTFFGRLYGIPSTKLKTRVAELLGMVQLSNKANQQVGTLSGGMQRRLNIAAALIHSPSILLMDEPTVGLDPQNRAKILELVRDIAASGATVLYSTHYMDEVEAICHRIGIIDHGKLLIEGTLAELRQRVAAGDLLALRGSFDTSKLPSVISLEADEKLVKSSPDELVFQLVNAERRLGQILTLLSNVGEVREISLNRQSLESLFIQLTGHELRE